MRTTLDLPDPLFRTLKARAASQGLKIKELLEIYVVEGLKRRGSPSASRSPLPVARARTGKLIPALANETIQQILDEEDAGH